MASILLLGESCPYRNASYLGTNSQGKAIANACALSIEEFNQMIDCEYLIKSYVPSFKRKHERYRVDLIQQWRKKQRRINEDYEVLLLLGKRLVNIVLHHDLDFFQIMPYHALKVVSIPNPLCEYWWNNDEHVKALSDFMNQILKKYA